MMPDAARQRSLLRLAFVAGCAVIAVLAAMRGMSSAPGCTVPPIVEFQFAGSAAGYAGVLAAAGPGCAETARAVYHAVNRIDLFALIPAYALFLGLFFAAMRHAHRQRAATNGLAVSLLAAALDAAETWLQLGVTGGERLGDGVFALITAFAGFKYILLAVGAYLAGIIFLGDRRSRLRFIGGIMLVSGIAAMFGAAFPDARILLGSGIGVAWLMIWLHALIATFARRPLPA